MSWTRRALPCLVVVTCLVAGAVRVEACMVCIPLPQETAADLLLGANVVVLARENPQKPFSYVAVEVLKGNLAAPGIDRFVDSTTRRRLALNPNRSVVLTLGGPEFPARASFWSPRSRDASPSRWRSLGYASPRYEAVVREILALAPRWREGVGLEARATYFMPYLTDAERPIRELAYLEVGQASYDTIRKADRFVPAEQLHAFLTDPQYLEWRALYILLLGVNANQHEKETIRAAIASRAHFNQTLNLSAWATALIEIDGERAVDWLEAMYLGTPDREPDAVLQVVKALSVQGAGERSGLRARIAESYGVLIEAHPSLAGWVAHDLTAWNDWRFAEALVDLRASQAELDSATAYAIDFYIARATSGASDRVRPLRAP